MEQTESCFDLLRLWYDRMDAADKTRLDRISLSHIPFNMYDHIDWPLISAFVERWQPDTNTFHIPFGEMTIMLHDVQLILGIQLTVL